MELPHPLVVGEAEVVRHQGLVEVAGHQVEGAGLRGEGVELQGVQGVGEGLRGVRGEGEGLQVAQEEVEEPQL